MHRQFRGDIEYTEDMHSLSIGLILLGEVLNSLVLNWGQRSFSSSADDSGSKTSPSFYCFPL